MQMLLDLPSNYIRELAASTASGLDRCIRPSPVSLTLCRDPWSLPENRGSWGP